MDEGELRLFDQEGKPVTDFEAIGSILERAGIVLTLGRVRDEKAYTFRMRKVRAVFEQLLFVFGADGELLRVENEAKQDI